MLDHGNNQQEAKDAPLDAKDEQVNLPKAVENQENEEKACIAEIIHDHKEATGPSEPQLQEIERASEPKDSSKK